MKHIVPLFAATLLLLTVSFPAFASSDSAIIGGGNIGSSSSIPSTISPDAPTVKDSIFRSMGDDYLDDKDFIAFDEENLVNLLEMFKGSLGSMTNIAVYGMILLLGIFAVAEIIRGIAL